MAALQFAAQAYQTRSPQLISQQCINAFVETSPKEAKTPVPVYGTPGLTLFSNQGSGPINGLHVFQAALYAMSGSELYGIDLVGVSPDVTGVATLIGNTTLGGLCSMADNGQQLVIVDGSAGWIFQPFGLNQVTTATAVMGATSIPANITGTITSGDPLTIPLDNGATFSTTASSTVTGVDTAILLTDPLPNTVSAGAIIIDPANFLGQITAPAFKPANTVTFFDSYFVFDAHGTRQFFISAINDGTQYSGLDFATASASSSNVLAVRAYHEQLLVFTRISTEVWWDVGAVSFPFQRYDAAYIERGCAAPLSVCSEDNTVFWMGDDGNFYRMEGFTPKRISTFAMETAWAQYPNRFLDCNAFVLDQEGHKFVVVNFPSGMQTWVYDISTNLWHQRESWGPAFPTGPTPLPVPFTATGVEITTPPVALEAATLAGLPSTYQFPLFSVWVFLPDDSSGTHGVEFFCGGGAGVSFVIINDQSSPNQIAVNLVDASTNPIVAAEYDLTGWVHWVNVLISADTAANVLQVYAGETALTPVSITWSSTNPVGNLGGPWVIDATISGAP